MIDFSPLLITIKAGVLATLLCFFLGIYAAHKVVRAGRRTRFVADALLTLPMVLPPTVAGFLLLLIFSTRRPLGMFLQEQLNVRVIQSFTGCVIAAMVIAFPLMYRNARAAFELVDITLIYAGRTLGMSETRIFFKIILPTAGPGIASGTILTFARAIGEYGATSMLAGNISGKTSTISQQIAMVMRNGDYVSAGFWVILMIVLAFVIILLINIISSKTKK